MEENFQDTVFHQLDFKHEILDSDKRLFMLIAGVGAGKNYWVKSLTEKGHEDKGYAPEGYKVLLITSRATTADAQAIKLGADKRFDFKKLLDSDDWWGDKPPMQKVVCCTNSYIEWYVKNLYDAEDSKTHVWNMFDFIILDEAHSMTSDATFSEAPFHTQAFLRHAHRSSKNCRIVLMSGTPEPADWLYKGINAEAVQVIDLYQQCRHIEPKHVEIHPSKTIVDNIVRYLNDGERLIYFATRSDSMKKLIEELNDRGISNDAIGISYREDKKKDEKFPPELVAKKVSIQTSLEEKEVLPPDVKIFITTSKNKEGININDEDIKSMIVESHQRDDVRQMAGRVRSGLDYLIIDRDAAQHSSSGSKLMYQINKACTKDVNEAFSKYWAKLGIVPTKEQKQSAIQKVEDAFRYLRYDYFQEKFRVYGGRKYGDAIADKSEYDFQHYISDWEEEEYTGNYSYGHDQLDAWFPNSTTNLSWLRNLREEVAKLFKERAILDRPITRAERDDLAEEIRELVKTCDQTDSNIRENFSNLTSAIKQLGYSCQEAPGVRKGTQYIISKM